MQLVEKSAEYLIFFSSLILLIVLFSFTQVLHGFAISPSFVKQEILAAPKDWVFWKDNSQNATIITHDGHLAQVEDAKTMSQCKTTKFVSPSISSVSYISDGKHLNATVWLTDKFKGLSSNDTIDIYPAYVKIKASGLPSNMSLSNYVDEKIASIYNPFNNFTIEENKTSTSISDNNAYKLVYSALTEDGVEVKNMTFWTFNNGKVYDITYSAKNDKYPNSLPIIQKIINSLKFENSFHNYDNRDGLLHQISNGYVLFRGLGMEIGHPTDWKEVKRARLDNQSESIIFRAPFADEALEQPSWHETKFTMALAIDSNQHPAITDYRTEYSRTLSDNSSSKSNISSWLWSKKVYEVSAADSTRLLEQEKNYTSFYKKDEPYYVLFSFDLSKINFPQQYRAVFYITDYFVIKHYLCRLVDTTPWAIIPPPEFTISTTTSNPLVLRPGDERNIEVTIKGNTHLPSEAFLTPDYHNENNNNNNISYNKKLIQVSFIPNRTSIVQYGSATSTMHVKALDNASETNPYGMTIPISANISFPTTITNRAGEIFNNSKSVNLLQTSNLTLTILPPYSPGEIFNNFVSTWVTPISGVWTFLAGVAAVLTPLIIRIYRKKERKKMINKGN